MKAEKEVSPSRRVFSLHACKHLEILKYGCLCCCLEIKVSTVREFLQVLVPSQTPLLPRKRAAAEHPRGASGFSFWPFFLCEADTSMQESHMHYNTFIFSYEALTIQLNSTILTSEASFRNKVIRLESGSVGAASRLHNLCENSAESQ